MHTRQHTTRVKPHGTMTAYNTCETTWFYAHVTLSALAVKTSGRLSNVDEIL